MQSADTQARGSKRRRRLLAAGLALAVVAGAFFVWQSLWVPRFGCVEEGILYRSGQPGRVALEIMSRLHGIRSVVNLRRPQKIATDPRAQEELEFVRANGLSFFSLPLDDQSIEEVAEEFLAIVADPANRPVLVHCAEGRERSGLMAALYRIAVNGWAAEEALREMREYGFRLEKYRRAQRFLDDYPPAPSGSE